MFRKSLVIVGLSLLMAQVGSTATLNISGEITNVCTLDSVTPSGSATTLPIVAGGNDIVVGTTSVTCNNGAGYDIDASSANNGLLVNDTSPNNTTAYNFEITGTGSQGEISLTTSDQNVVSHTSLAAPITSDSRNIEVDVTAVSIAYAGTYEDTITITLTAL
jgi:hypothetical protein